MRVIVRRCLTIIKVQTNSEHLGAGGDQHIWDSYYPLLIFATKKDQNKKIRARASGLCLKENRCSHIRA